MMAGRETGFARFALFIYKRDEKESEHVCG